MSHWDLLVFTAACEILVMIKLVSSSSPAAKHRLTAALIFLYLLAAIYVLIHCLNYVKIAASSCQ